MANKFGAIPTTVDGIRKPWAENDDAVLAAMRRKGHSFRRIAEQMGRSRKGGSSRFAKLSERDVRAIRIRLSQDESRSALASECGLSKSGLDHVAAGRTWRYI